eukprot:4606717-Pyramimonas_sp.AAC.1
MSPAGLPRGREHLTPQVLRPDHSGLSEAGPAGAFAKWRFPTGRRNQSGETPAAPVLAGEWPRAPPAHVPRQ